MRVKIIVEVTMDLPGGEVPDALLEELELENRTSAQAHGKCEKVEIRTRRP